jgi:predicted lipid-binding transport protein (Tim44 family)
MDAPQFQKAEYSGAKGGDVCKFCRQPVGASYYRVGEAIACEACAQKAKNDLPQDTHAAYMRGLLFGIGGAIVGLILYAAFSIMTGLIIGYVALAVGYIVGKAIKAGSRGLGGRRYQITAVLLTYAAVSIAAVPIAISEIVKERKAQPAAHVERQPAPDTTAGAPGSAAPGQQSNPEKTPAERKSLGFAVLTLLIIGLASPFLALQDPFHGLIGLVILLVGLQIAWRITGGNPAAQFVGPFKNPSATPQAPPSLG